MRTWMRSKVRLLFMTCAVLLAIPAIALADQINVDGDIVATGNNNPVSLGNVNPGQTLTPQVSFQLNCNSNDHVNRNATVSLNFDSAASSAGVSATNAAISVPNTWPTDTNGCSSVANLNDTGNSQVTFNAPKASGAQSVTVVYNVVAPTDANGSTGIQGSTTRSVTYNMTVNNLPPTIDSFTGPTSTTEGNTENYSVSASDPNDTTLSYSLVALAGGASTTITGGTTASPQVKFNAPGTVTLRETVSSGGNTVTQDKTVTVAPANTAPVVSVTGVNNNGSYEIGAEPNAGCSVTDTEDGSSASATPDIDRSALNSFGLGTVTVTCSYEDTGGLSDSDTMTYTIVDTTDPTASHELSTPANGNGWHKADFTVTLNGSDDPGSGVKELHYTIDNGTEQVASGASKVLSINTEGIKDISYYSVDNAGNESAVGNVTVRLDKTPPTIDGSASPAPNGAGWNNTPVTVSFDCADTLSEVASCPADVTLSSDGADQSVTRSATDNAGNSASDTVSNIDIDKTKPSVNVTGVSQGGAYITGNVPTPGCDTQDQAGLSGVKTHATVNVTGSNNGFGTFTATCSGAVDNADNAGDPKSVTYTVQAAFNGFLQPIDGHSVNAGKYGRTYPIKWQLRDSSGALISDSAAQLLVGTMTGGQKAVSCTSFDLTDTDVLEESTTGNTALRYDATSDQFIYNYKAPSSGSCYVFAIRNADGVTTQQIDFKFTK